MILFIFEERRKGREKMKKIIIGVIGFFVISGFLLVSNQQIIKTTWAGRPVLGQYSPDKKNFIFFLGTDGEIGSMESSITMPLSEALYFL